MLKVINTSASKIVLFFEYYIFFHFHRKFSVRLVSNYCIYFESFVSSPGYRLDLFYICEHCLIYFVISSLRPGLGAHCSLARFFFCIVFAVTFAAAARIMCLMQKKLNKEKRVIIIYVVCFNLVEI